MAHCVGMVGVEVVFGGWCWCWLVGVGCGFVVWGFVVLGGCCLVGGVGVVFGGLVG